MLELKPLSTDIAYAHMTSVDAAAATSKGITCLLIETILLFFPSDATCNTWNKQYSRTLLISLLGATKRKCMIQENVTYVNACFGKQYKCGKKLLC